MRRFRSGLTALSVLCLLAAGCTSNTGTSATVSGGTLTWGKQAEALEIDPQVGGNGVSWGIEDLVYETLTGVGDDLTIQPRLATSWEQPSSTSYVFHLRQGVKFSNGRVMTADDVVASFKRLIDPKLASYWTQQVGPITDVVAVDAKTVRFELSTPFTPFLAAIAHVGAAILPMKEFAAGTFDPSKQLMGTGPFMQVSHNQGESWTFARNPNYWRSGYPKVDKLIVKIIPDDSARLAALRDGSVDVATFENVDASKLLASVPNVKSVVQDSTDFNVIHVNALGPTSPFRDARVRDAFSMAIDRTQLRSIALGGIGQVQGVVSPSFKVPGCSPSALPNFSHDVTKAKQLLADAGKTGMSFELLLTTAFATAPGEAQVIQQNLKDIGVNVKITQLEIGAWETRTFVKNPPEMDASISWFAGYADPGMVIAWWNPDYALFDKGYMQKDPQLIDLINQARTTPAGSARNNILGQVCQLIDQDANIIPLASRPDIVGYRSDHISARIQPVEGYGDVLRHIQEFAKVSGS